MRVAQVTLRFDAPGGVETNVREISTRLRRTGVDVEVFASDLYDEAGWDRRSDFRPSVDGVPVHRFPVYKRLIPGLTLPLLPGLVGALADSGVDIIHAHSHRYGHVLQSAAVAASERIPLVVSTHYHPADRHEPALKRGMLRCQDFGFGATAYRVARALVVETALEKRWVSEFAPSDRIWIIPPGVDLGGWTSDTADGPLPVGLPSEYILYAGRLASNKGLAILLEALALLPSDQRVPLVLLGSDWGERARLEARVRDLGLTGLASFVGHVDDPRSYRALFRHARLFVLPSEWEAFGLVLLEAMAARIPIVATAVGGVPEVLENGRCGQLVPYGDPRALASAIAGLLADPVTCANLVTAGRARVEQFTWDRAAERHRALYESLARSAPARAG